MTKWHRIFVAGAFVSLAGIGCADTLVLKNGTTVEGTFLGGSARDVRFDDGRNVRNFPVGEVSRIDFQGSSAAAQESDSEAAPPRRAPRPRLLEPDERDDSPVDVAARRPARPRPVEADERGDYAAEVPGGTPITVRLIDAVDSRTAQLGQTFAASVDEPVMVGGQTVIPRGADVIIKLVEDQQSGRITGETSLGLALSAIRVNGRMVDFSSEAVQERSGSRGARSGKIIGGGTALGAIIGGIAGGGRGAAIGAVSGAAAGTGAEIATKGERVRVPSETRLSFRTSNPVRL